MSNLTEAAERARRLLERAVGATEASLAELEECGIDHRRPIEEQVKELEAEAARALEHAQKLLEDLDDLFEGS